MSLDADLSQNKKIQEKAKEFSELVWANKKKEALDYYNKLSLEIQNYIKMHKSYSLDLKAACFRG